MESMGYLGFIWGIVAFVWCAGLTAQFRQLKQTVQDAGIGHSEKASLREILERSIGKNADLKLESIGLSFGSSLSDCQVLEVDEEWALVLTGKKQEEKLVRIRSIRSVSLKG
ncbi:MAG: hypothetical protein GXY06_05490 [Clostridiaceae bacterium]|nr:hypothetical protein [Clostridiaceae bacterium]